MDDLQRENEAGQTSMLEALERRVALLRGENNVLRAENDALRERVEFLTAQREELKVRLGRLAGPRL